MDKLLIRINKAITKFFVCLHGDKIYIIVFYNNIAHFAPYSNLERDILILHGQDTKD